MVQRGGGPLKPRTIALLSLGLTAIGTGIAGIQLWPRDEPRYTTGATPQVSEVAAATPGVSDCSAGNVSGGQVSIDCSQDVNISSAASTKPFTVISEGLDSTNISSFATKIEAVENRIVRLQLHADSNDGPGYSISVDNETTPGRLVLTYSDPCDGTHSGCGGTEFVFSTQEGGRIYWNNGGWSVDGYFSVQPVQGMHMGYVSVSLVGIPDSQAQLADPSAR